MQSEKASLRVFEVVSIKDSGGGPLIAYGSPVDATDYEAALRDVVTGKVRTKEPTGFKEHMGERPVYRADFWWDIENDMMMSFDSGFMAALPQILEASWAWMDAQAAKG
jgi:hypothetical protein